jgi:predicted  nucleic acid-binding Zn-ribbon protein
VRSGLNVNFRLLQEIRFLKNENSKLRVQLKDCEEAFQLANHETEKSNKVAREAKQKLHDLEKENADLKESVQAAGAKAADLELRLKDAEAKLKSDENSKAALNADLDRLKATIHDRELKLRSLEEEIANKEKSLKDKLVEKNIAVEELSSKVN